MRFSQRVQSLPPYLFAGIERKIAERKAAGRDVISLGIGDPDLPTPAHIVSALAQAAADPATHQYPSNQGEPAFREAVASFYATRFGVHARRGLRDRAAARSQGGHRARLPRPARPWRRRSRRRPRLPGLRHGPDARRRRGGPAAAPRRPRLPARPRGDRRPGPRAREDDLRQLPQQPDGRRHRGRLLRAPGGVRARARPRGRARQRLRRHHLRRLRRPQLPADAGRARGRASRCSASPRATT